MIATIQKWGNSNGIRIPKIFLDELNINENENVEIIKEDNRIIIQKRQSKYKSLDELFTNYKGDYKGEEYDWGKPIEKEVW